MRKYLVLLFAILLSPGAFAADLTKGKTFGSTEEVTAAKLHSLVDSGTVTNLTQADVKAGEGIVKRDTSAPSDTDQLWLDTSFTPPILRGSDGSIWQPASLCYVRMENQSGAQRVAGDVVVLDTSNDTAFTTTTTASVDTVVGAVMETINSASSGLVAVCGGPVTVKVAGTVNRGEFLTTSTTEVRAKAVASLEDGVFGMATTANASGNGTVTAILLRR